ncbi:MAG: hypothetical protein ABIJ92_01220 [Candidatus Aenigmatarchaeota archaeon]
MKNNRTPFENGVLLTILFLSVVWFGTGITGCSDSSNPMNSTDDPVVEIQPEFEPLFALDPDSASDADIVAAISAVNSNFNAAGKGQYSLPLSASILDATDSSANDPEGPTGGGGGAGGSDSTETGGGPGDLMPPLCWPPQTLPNDLLPEWCRIGPVRVDMTIVCYWDLGGEPWTHDFYTKKMDDVLGKYPGRVNLTVVHGALDRFDILASQAAETAALFGKYEQYVAELIANHDAIANGEFEKKEYVKLARKVGIKGRYGRWFKQLISSRLIRAEVQSDMRHVFDYLGIGGIPSFRFTLEGYCIGEIGGSQSPETFFDIMDPYLDILEPSIPGGGGGSGSGGSGGGTTGGGPKIGPPSPAAHGTIETRNWTPVIR